MDHIIRTYSGRLLDFDNLHESMIHIEDIAHALSREGRWGNHSKLYYSVAEHSVQLSYISESPFEALMHDASEAYMRDLPSPLKKMLPDYQKKENELMRIIMNKYGISEIPEEVHYWDKELSKHEWANVVVKANWRTLSAGVSKKAFLKRFEELCYT